MSEHWFRLPPLIVHPTPLDAEIQATPWHVVTSRVADARIKFEVDGTGIRAAIGDTGFDKAHFESGNLARSYGPGQLLFWDRPVTGVPGSAEAATAFGTTSSFGISPIGGVDARVMQIPAYLGTQGLLCLHGSPANGDSSLPSVSDDGRLVAFVSQATNLVESDHNDAQDAFVRDLLEQTTLRLEHGNIFEVVFQIMSS
jgi:hypothetical protein